MRNHSQKSTVAVPADLVNWNKRVNVNPLAMPKTKMMNSAIKGRKQHPRQKNSDRQEDNKSQDLGGSSSRVSKISLLAPTNMINFTLGVLYFDEPLKCMTGSA